MSTSDLSLGVDAGAVRRSSEKAPGHRHTDEQQTLDYGWWASNGPTGGYLMRLALHAISSGSFDVAQTRRLDLSVLAPATDTAYRTAATYHSGPNGLSLAAVESAQRRTFAVATVLASPGLANSAECNAVPPRVMPPEGYPVMTTPSPTLPPVTARFRYRPVPSAAVAAPDAVWLTPTDDTLTGRRLVVSAIDSWYPAHYMRAVRLHLAGAGPLRQPRPTNLAGVRMAFTAPDPAYEDLHDILLASEATAEVEGHHLERCELWSVSGDLLATADVVRRESYRSTS